MSEVDENLELIEEYIRKLKWSDDTPDIHKTLVAGNIRAFYAWVRSHLTPRAADLVACSTTMHMMQTIRAFTFCPHCGVRLPSR